MVSGQRLQPVDAVAIHDPWLVVEMRRDSRGNGVLGSGDLLYELQRITLSAIWWQFTRFRRDQDGYD